MIAVVIDRKKWYRGQGSETSCLLTRNNKMCCIGFLARVLGYTPKVIRYRAELELVDPRDEFTYKYSPILQLAYIANDNPTITEGEREKSIKQYGRNMDVHFSFIN